MMFSASCAKQGWISWTVWSDRGYLSYTVNSCKICYWLIKHIICGYIKKEKHLLVQYREPFTAIYCWGEFWCLKKNHVSCFPIFVSRACNWWDIYGVMCALLSEQRLFLPAAVDNKMAGPFLWYLTRCFNMPPVVCLSEYETYGTPSAFCVGIITQIFSRTANFNYCSNAVVQFTGCRINKCAPFSSNVITAKSLLPSPFNNLAERWEMFCSGKIPNAASKTFSILRRLCLHVRWINVFFSLCPLSPSKLPSPHSLHKRSDRPTDSKVSPPQDPPPRECW